MRVYRINGLSIRLFCAALIFTAGCANQATKSSSRSAFCALHSPQGIHGTASSAERSTENAERKSDPNEPLWLKYGKQDLHKWPRRLLDDSKATFLRLDNATALLLAGGASIIMNNNDIDTNVANHFDKHSSFHGFEDESLYVLGYPLTHACATGLWYFISAQNDDMLNMQRAWTMRTALTLTYLATTGLKLARDNETPNGKNYAWPSGHTSSSFTVASVLDEFYGPKVGIPAYVAASVVAYRMMDTGDHWASDVVFGATLGWVVGHTVAGRHKKLELAGFDIVPYVSQTEEPKTGVGFLKRF